ncbi:MAG: SRPBCC family protein [Bacteroidetes bacterium]|nr:MAG: SRPBCC family protein [Bacteroidota bacterium]MBL1144182.1 SRPBCC family protein [Bacteroidota bacterium]NOG56978.1 SRPBCC family protein [Bacteroidota bacterium]
MTRIETDHKITSNSQKQLFDFLTDLNNFEKLMPQDKIEKWSSGENQCEFTIKGMARIGLKKESQTEHELIKISSFGKVPFSFNLDIHIAEKPNNGAEAYMVFEGDINPFMKMMVVKPLTNFFNMLVTKASEIKL